MLWLWYFRLWLCFVFFQHFFFQASSCPFKNPNISRYCCWSKDPRSCIFNSKNDNNSTGKELISGPGLMGTQPVIYICCIFRDLSGRSCTLAVFCHFHNCANVHFFLGVGSRIMNCYLHAIPLFMRRHCFKGLNFWRKEKGRGEFFFSLAPIKWSQVLPPPWVSPPRYQLPWDVGRGTAVRCSHHHRFSGCGAIKIGLW